MPTTFRPAGSVARHAARSAYDRERRAVSDTRRLYGTSRWQALRAAQLAAEPLCRMCDDEGRVGLASVCDHVTPHRGDVVKFWAGPFQSLCATHHNAAKQSSERANIGTAPPGGVESSRSRDC